MKIAHISDLHIRNFKYRKEYDVAFSELYRQLRIIAPDLVINTGDTVHSKLSVSPELFDDVAKHLLAVSSIAPYWVVLGNHDLNLKNADRTDAISPIVRALQGRTKNELRMPQLLSSGPERMLYDKFPDFAFWNYDIRHPVEKVIPHVGDINVGLYHGSIAGCVTDQGFVMDEAEAEVKQFHGMDFVLLGDIHKRQSFRDGRMQYPGSLIQQNYGEGLEKGFLVWDIRSRDDFSVSFHEIKNVPGRFHTVQVPSNLDLTGVDVPKGSRIRAVVQGEFSPSKRLELERLLTERFAPTEVITPDSSGERASRDTPSIDDLVESREQMMRDHLKERGLDESSADAVVKLFAEYEKGLELDSSARGTTWQLKKIAWDNMMNYGDGNVIDFSKLKGLVGVFAPNASGKSSIFDILLQSLFDKVSKDVPRNIDLVNDNKDSGKMNVELESAGTPFSIERTIERIHYGQRKLAEVKQWGKTTLDFSSVDESLNGTSRPETERAIRNVIGNFEDFSLTTMLSQNPIFGLPGGGDIINCRETDRRKIMFRFLDLDVYEKVNQACRDELKTVLGTIKTQERDTVSGKIDGLILELQKKQAEFEQCTADVAQLESELLTKKADLVRLEADDRLQHALDLGKLEDQTTSAARRFRTASKLVDSLKQTKTLVEEKYENLLVKRPERPEMSLADLAKRMDAVVSQRESGRLNLSQQKDALTRGKKSLVTLENVPCEGKFPSCKFISEASEFLSQRAIIEAAVQLHEAVVEVTSREISSLEDMEVQHADVVRWDHDVAETKLQLEKAKFDLDKAWTEFADAERAANSAQKAYDEALSLIDLTIRSQIDDLKCQLDKMQAQLYDEKRLSELILKSLGALDSKKQALRDELARIDEQRAKVKVYEQLVDLTGKNGLPYKILTLVLPLINDEISKILSGIVKFNVFFEDDPEEQSISLYIRYGDFKSRPLSLGSGAEKFIASLAIRVALLSVSSLPKTDILIIDEGFGKLDPEHLEALQRMFEYLKSAFGSVFIVSHVDFMRDIVDHSIEITAQNGYAHVEVA